MKDGIESKIGKILGKHYDYESLVLKQLAQLFTSYANEVANKAVAEFAKNLKSIEYPPSGKEYHFEDGSWTNIESLYPYLDQLRTKTGEE